MATDLARQAADRARTAAGWLAERDPGSLLDEFRTFAGASQAPTSPSRWAPVSPPAD